MSVVLTALHANRLTAEQALRHPAFWNSELNMRLIACIANRMIATDSNVDFRDSNSL